MTSRSYACCDEHTREALRNMIGATNVVIRDVTGVEGYKCFCLKPATIFLIESARKD